jgi:hypothetical protein
VGRVSESDRTTDIPFELDAKPKEARGRRSASHVATLTNEAMKAQSHDLLARHDIDPVGRRKTACAQLPRETGPRASAVAP